MTATRHRILFSDHPDLAATVIAGAAKEDSTAFALHPSVTAVPAPEIPKLPNIQDVELIATGGMGVVYRGRQTELKRTVAIKMLRLKQRQDQDALVRLHSEAAAMAQLRHPAITQVFEYGSYNEAPYIVMEYVDGGTLADVIKASGRVLPMDAANMVETIAHAIQHAHDRAIIHRDLKPSNILLTKEGLPKVSDFGVAKLQNHNVQLTQANQFMGTPQYTAPEQLQPTGAITTQVDIYSLGVILYELLTGQPAHQGKTHGEVIYQVVHVEPARPRKLFSDIPADLETICVKCLQKDPAKRYQSAEALAHDLRCFQEKMPITARPVSVTERAWKWCRRHPLSAILLAWVVALLLIGTYVSFYFSFWAITESNRASQAEAAKNLERNKALAAKRRAEEQSELAIKTNHFLQENLLLPIAESMKQPTQRNVQLMKDALDRAVRQVDERYANQPQLEAILRQLLGEIYFRLGHNQEAMQQLEKGFALRVELPGLTSVEQYRGTGTLVLAYYKDNQFAKALQILLNQIQAYLDPEGLERE